MSFRFFLVTHIYSKAEVLEKFLDMDFKASVSYETAETRHKDEFYLKEGMLIHTFQLDSSSLYCTATKQKHVSALLGPYGSAKEAIDKMAHQTTVKRLLLNAVQQEFNREVCTPYFISDCNTS